MNEVEAYAQELAKKYNIDWPTLRTVINGEGGFNNPYRQSDIVKNGVREPSFGPLQLYMKGMGADALQAGIDPRTDWKGGLEYGVQQASRGGWGPWYGAKAHGITGMEGIGRPGGVSLTSTPVSVASGAPAPALPPPVSVADHPVAEVAAATDPAAAPVSPLMDAITKLTEGSGKDGTGVSKLGALAAAISPQQKGPIGQLISTGALQSSDAVQQSQMANAQQLMQTLLTKKRRVPGLSLGGMPGMMG